MRGIEIKDDTYAAIKVVMSNGFDWPLLDSSGPFGTSTKGNTNFLLQQVTEQRMEKHQIVETFGDSYVFFFGESPRFLDCTALLINTLDFNWRAEWWANYEHYLRGTKLVELGARCYMFWDDNVVEGYMLNCQASETAEAPYTVSLAFKFFVTKYDNVSFQNDPEQYPVRSSVKLPPGVELRQSDAFERLQAYYRGESYGERAQDAVSRESEVVQSAASRNEKSKITSKLRQLPHSMVVDPAVWQSLVGVRGIANTDEDSVLRRVASPSGALRGLIRENIDEYVSGAPTNPGGNSRLQTPEQDQQNGILPSELASSDREEVENLERSTVSTLETIGARANNPRTIRDLGLGPNFTPGWRSNATAFAGAGVGVSAGGGVGASVSFGASASAGASFSPVVNASLNVGVGASARAGVFANAQAQSSTFIGARSRLRDPLGNVYGRSLTSVDEFSSTRRQYVEGGGDYSYGYISVYGRIGVGRAGYGDFGGRGFGSGNRRGDPGFLEPERFTFRNVDQQEPAFNAFVRARNDQTAVATGSLFGSASVSGGASLQITGSATAFSMVAVEGNIDPYFSGSTTRPRNLNFNQNMGSRFDPRRNPHFERGFSRTSRQNFEAETSIGLTVNSSTRSSLDVGPGGFSANAQASFSVF